MLRSAISEEEKLFSRFHFFGCLLVKCNIHLHLSSAVMSLRSHEKCRKQSKPLKNYIYERQKWDDDKFFHRNLYF